jgi:hypothetical protein
LAGLDSILGHPIREVEMHSATLSPKSGQKINATNGMQTTVDFVDEVFVYILENPNRPISLANLRPHPTKQDEWIVELSEVGRR